MKTQTLVTALVVSAFTAPAQNQSADLLLRHAAVLTVNAQDQVAEAVAIRNGRILAVGTDSELAHLIGTHTQVIDLAGRTVTPGFIDAHAHVLAGFTDMLYKADLTSAASVSEILSKIKEQASKTAPGEWVEGFGWNEGIIAEHRAPTLAELDAVTAGHPALLENVSHHYGMLNSTALAKAGIDAQTKDPAGGTIVKDAGGNPTGIVKEAAQGSVFRAIPPLSPTQYRKGLKSVLNTMHSEGLTGVKDIVYPDAWAAYLSFAESDGITAHVCPLMWAGTTVESARIALAAIQKGRSDASSIKGNDLTVCGAKILLDGSAMGRTAWRNEDYPPDPHRPGPLGHGYSLVDPAQYRAMVKLFNAAGISIGTHAIGDQAINLVVDSYAEALQESPHMGLRHAVIHSHEPTDHAIAVMQELQSKYDAAIPEAQAGFLYWLGDTLPAVFGPQQSQHLMPFATYRKHGIVFAGGSDFPVTTLSPEIGLWATVAREPLKGTFGANPFGTAESVDIHVALKSYTIWAARQLFIENETGTIEPGKWADLALWDRNPYAIPTSDLKNMKCMITLYKGNVVFNRDAVH